MNEAATTTDKAHRLHRLLLFSLPFLLSASWVMWWPWPAPENRPIPWVPDVIIALGGGDNARARETSRIALAFPHAPVLISGDGGHMEGLLRADPVTRDRLFIEPDAKSTWENAIFSAKRLDQFHATKVVLVTNWFHVPRAEAVFAKALPHLEIATSFEPAPHPITPWDKRCHRREKLAAVWYLVRYGVNSFLVLRS
jgi:uncharacterized SAM-binding protein YcdF (DUF218 family)